MSQSTLLQRSRIGIGLTVGLAILSFGCPQIDVPLPGGGNMTPDQNTNGDQSTNGDQDTNGQPADPALAPINDVAGQPGFGSDSGLPGMVITILRVTTADTNVVPQIGKPVSVTFTLKTRGGSTIPASELTRFSTYISGIGSDYQRVIPAEGDVSKIRTNGDGTYTYVFANPLPEKFPAPLNDSSAFGPDDGERTGEALVPGTYSIGIEARRPVMREDETFNDAGDAVLDFLIGDGPLTHRQVVIAENCMACHGQISVHGANRFSVTGCVLCHTDGAEDRISSDPAKATPDVTIEFANLIHRIHRGYDLPLVKASANSSDPYRYTITGFGESVNDFSKVVFPMMPGGTGFNEQTRNCAACHKDAAEGDRAYTHPSAAACLGCHDDVNLADGTILDDSNSNVSGGRLTKAQLFEPAFRKQIGGFNHTFDNTQCALCHAKGTSLDVSVVHLPKLSDPALINGIRVDILDVSGNSDPGFFKPGDRPVVTFRLLDKNDQPIAIDDPTQVVSMSFVLSGPVDNYQLVLPATGTTATVKSTAFNATTGAVTGQTINVTPNGGFGPFTYTAAAIPATYRAPLNDSTAFAFADGSGELSGRALQAGNYTIALWAAHEFPIPSTSRFREASAPGLKEIAIGAPGTLPGYLGLVTDAKCNACHGDLRFHGNGRKSVNECVLCHNAGAEDRPVAAGQTEHPAPDSIDFKVMIHKIHNARELTVVKSGGKYDLGGFGGIADFSNGELPYMQGAAENCTACHATDAWKSPVEVDTVRVWKVACTSCHDGDSTMAHVDINTAPPTANSPGNESCATCHGPGRAFAVDKLHRIP